MQYKLQKLSVLLLVFLGNTPSAYSAKYSNPPIEVPLYLGNTGKMYEFNALITEQVNYEINVYFYLTSPNKWFKFLNKQTPEKAKQIYQILGGRFLNNHWSDNGVPAKFNVQIVRKKDKKVILNDTITNPVTNATYMGRYATLANLYLLKGEYLIKIKYLDGDLILAPLQAKFMLTKAYQGK